MPEPPKYSSKNLNDDSQFLCQKGDVTWTNRLNLDGSPKRSFITSYYTNSNTNIPMEILNTGNIEVLNNYLSEHSGELNEKEKRHLQERIDVMNYFNSLEKYYQDNSRTSVGPMQLNNNNQMVLPGIFMDREQDTGLGCWSCALSMLLKGRGVNVDQKLIRRYRPEFVKGNEIASPQQTDILNSNMMSEVYQYSSLVDKICPNTMMCKIDKGDSSATDEEIKAAVLSALKDKNAPVAFCNGGHWTTIVGVNEQTGKFYVVNSLYSDPGYIEEVSMNTYLGNPRGQFVWMEDIVLEKDGSSKQLQDKHFTIDKNSGAVLPDIQGHIVKGGTDMSTRGNHIIDTEHSIEYYVPKMVRNYNKTYQQQKAESDQYLQQHDDVPVQPKDPKYTPVQNYHRPAVQRKLQQDAYKNMITERKAHLRDHYGYSQQQIDTMDDDKANKAYNDRVKQHTQQRQPNIQPNPQPQVMKTQTNPQPQTQKVQTNPQPQTQKTKPSPNIGKPTADEQQLSVVYLTEYLKTLGFSKNELDSMDEDTLRNTYDLINSAIMPEDDPILETSNQNKDNDEIDFKALGISEEEYLYNLQQQGGFDKIDDTSDLGGIELSKEELELNLKAFSVPNRNQNSKEPVKNTVPPIINKTEDKKAVKIPSSVNNQLNPNTQATKSNVNQETKINGQKQKEIVNDIKQPEKKSDIKLPQKPDQKIKNSDTGKNMDFSLIETALKSIADDKLVKDPGKASKEYTEMVNSVNGILRTANILRGNSAFGGYSFDDFKKSLAAAAEKANAFKEICFAQGREKIKGKTLDQFTIADSIIRLNDMTEKGITDPTTEMKKVMATKIVVMAMGYDAADLEPEELEAKAEQVRNSDAFKKSFGKDDFTALNKKATLNEDSFNKLIKGETKAYKKTIEEKTKTNSGPSLSI